MCLIWKSKLSKLHSHTRASSKGEILQTDTELNKINFKRMNSKGKSGLFFGLPYVGMYLVSTFSEKGLQTFVLIKIYLEGNSIFHCVGHLMWI